MRFGLGFGACLVGLAASACAGAGAGDAPTGVEASAINMGELSPDTDNAVVAVRVVRPPPWDGDLCTGTLVASNVMLTSLECVTLFDSHQAVTCLSDGTLDTTGTMGGAIGDPLTPHDIRVYYGSSLGDEAPSAYGAQVFVTGTPEVCEDDLAAVVLDRSLPSAGYALRLSPDVTVGEEVTAIGWGQSDYDARFKRDVAIIAVGPDDTTNGPGDAAPRSFLVGNGLCFGDRGGPALSDDTGAVVGIYARPLSGGSCVGPDRDVDGVNRFVKLAPYESMIRQAFDAAGATLVTDAPSGGEPSGKHAAGCALSRGAPGGSSSVALWVLALGAGLRRRKRARAT
ncbi:MAG TPA: trypsin-like serine protease [Polyangiaceae bacterium]|nr:trypsin-like serine protease [Polyangiaceae bacterium]